MAINSGDDITISAKVKVVAKDEGTSPAAVDEERNSSTGRSDVTQQQQESNVTASHVIYTSAQHKEG